MIGEARAVQLRSPGDFADGLSAWLRGDESPEGEAAGSIVGETLLIHRAWLKAQFKRD